MCRELTPHGNVSGKEEYRGKQTTSSSASAENGNGPPKLKVIHDQAVTAPRAARIRSAHLAWRAASPRGAAFACGCDLGCGMLLTCD
jgi:hypothetical protein